MGNFAYAAAVQEAEMTKQQLDQNLEVLIKSNGVLVGVGQPSHDPTLLVVTNTLLKEVGFAPATFQTFRRKVHINNIGATTPQHNEQDMKSKPDKKHATPVMVTKQDVTNSQTGAHCSESCSIHSKGHLVL